MMTAILCPPCISHLLWCLLALCYAEDQVTQTTTPRMPQDWRSLEGASTRRGTNP